MKTAAVLTALSLAATASGQTITQTFDYAWDFQGEDLFQSFLQFDTMGGTRELTDVRFGLDGIYSLAFIFENAGGTPLAAAEYDPSPLTFGGILPLNAELDLGSIASEFQPLVSVDLTASDGVPGSGPDSQFYAVDGSLSGVVHLLPGDFAAVTGNGSILFEYLFFPSIDLPLGVFAGVQFVDHQQFGTLTVEYDYTEVPAPAACALLGLAALPRRRRA